MKLSNLSLIMTEISPVAGIASMYIRTELVGDRVVYTQHVHEGSGASTTHHIRELGEVTYVRPGTHRHREILGTIADIRV